MKQRRFLMSALVAAVLSFPLTAQAGQGHRSMPALDGKSPGLTMKVIRYTGGTNGKMVVEIKNPGRRTVAFKPQGLFFVPEGDPEKAPQRLGAAGPFEVSVAGQWKHRQKLRLVPGRTVRIQLQVFCIDSHRSSPSARHKFRMAAKLLPKTLRRTINRGARKHLRRAKGRMPAAKSAIQSHIWKSRNAKWIRLEGERAREKRPNRRRQRRYRNRRPLRRIQQRLIR